MVAIELRFTAGRFHATPWGRHVNEAAAEWPPSPWRLLRALIAIWHRKCRHLDEATIRSLVGHLTALPAFHLPPASVGHTRHYMPRFRRKKVDLVFDAFVTVAREARLAIVWPELHLADGETQALRELVANLGYFGRAESWVEATYRGDWDGQANCRPASDAFVETQGDLVSVLAPVSPEDYAGWRDQQRAALLDGSLAEKRSKALQKGKDAGKVKLSRADQAKVLQYVPDDLFAALHAETTDLRKQGWSLPPGARVVHYVRPVEALAARPPPPRPRPSRRPTVARYALCSTVLPPLTEALGVGELMRRALLSASDALPVFAGKDADGQPLSGHRHAFVLPADDDDDGRLDHIVVYCREGFGPTARRALSRVRRLWQAGGRPDVHLVLTSLGEPADTGGWRAENDETPLLSTSTLWCSRTPFVLVRHPKRRRDGAPKLREDGTWIDGPEDQLRRELTLRGWPTPQRVDLTRTTIARGRGWRWLHFRRHRKRGGGRLGVPVACGFRLQFAEPQTGPLALGYGAHFGLGQFVGSAGPA